MTSKEGISEMRRKRSLTLGSRKSYETVYWGKMPVNFRPTVYQRNEVERAVAYAERSSPDVPHLVPDFSLLAVGKDGEGKKTAVLKLGEDRARVVRQNDPQGDLEGLLEKVALRIRSRHRRIRHGRLRRGF